MIHIATIHWKFDDFLDIQRHFIQQNLEHHRIWAYLDSMPDIERHRQHYNFAEDSGLQAPGEKSPRHAEKFQSLAERIALHEDTKREDVILFLDGDAWPILPADDYIARVLQRCPLGAVIRDENAGDQQPHPCFCFTTVEFWKSHNLHWGLDRVDSPSFPRRVDIGGWLLQYLKHNDIEWHRMRRTHSLRDHPVFFGIYDSLVYHHGAGYRKPQTMDDVLNKRKIKTRQQHIEELQLLTEELEHFEV